jgi:hypothetical protein
VLIQEYYRNSRYENPMRLIVVNTLGAIILFRKFLVSQKFRIHTLGAHVLRLLGLLDTISMGFVGGIVGTGIFLLKS